MSRKRQVAVSAAEHMSSFKDSIMSVSKHGMKFRASVSSTVFTINVLVVGFLVIPNNVMYFLNHTHRVIVHPGIPSGTGGVTAEELAAYHSHLHSGIALTVIGTLALVISIVMSVFVVRRRKKAIVADPVVGSHIKSVITCIVLMNIELFMAIIAGAMELLYRPLTKSAETAYVTECVVSSTNLVVYALYIVSVIMTVSMLTKDPSVHAGTSADSEKAYNTDDQYNHRGNWEHRLRQWS